MTRRRRGNRRPREMLERVLQRLFAGLFDELGEFDAPGTEPDLAGDIDLPRLEATQRMLLRLGIASSLSRAAPRRPLLMADGKGLRHFMRPRPTTSW